MSHFLAITNTLTIFKPSHWRSKIDVSLSIEAFEVRHTLGSCLSHHFHWRNIAGRQHSLLPRVLTTAQEAAPKAKGAIAKVLITISY